MIDPVLMLEDRRALNNMSEMQLAKAIGVSQPYISMVLCRKKPCGPKVLRYLGLGKEKKISITYSKL